MTLSPNKDSITSGKRANRGFVSLEKSTRKGRRVVNRQNQSGIFDGKAHKPGEKGLCASGPHARKQWMYTAGGSMKCH